MEKNAGKKKDKQVSRRSFLSDSGKTLLFGSLAAAAIPTFLEGCAKDEACNVLREDGHGNHYCNDEYICTDSQGFACPAAGRFDCKDDGFSCYTVFNCTPESNFSCLPSSSFSHNVGGGGS